ncbi:MAG TPA: hypothetical protein GXZ51_00275 [Acholeplasma sp.]|nr:hypothetical protein [Acholeplasma sp.]
MILEISIFVLLRIIFLSFLAVGFFFMLLNGLVRNSNYKRKAFYNFLLGVGFVSLFVISYLYDRQNTDMVNFTKHYVLIGVSGFYLVTLTIYNYIQGARKNERLFKGGRSSKPKDFIYILLKYQDGYLLEKTNDKYLAVIQKMKTNFHDEEVSKFASNYGNCFNVSYKGIVLKKDYNYYCYLIETVNLNPKLEYVDQFQLTKVMMSAEDKEIILSIILRNDFVIDKRI